MREVAATRGPLREPQVVSARPYRAAPAAYARRLGTRRSSRRRTRLCCRPGSRGSILK